LIYITGDTHGEQSRFQDLAMRYGENEWTKDDYLIICGDFGYLFENSEKENAFLDRLAEKPYTVCFCDGNHENFPAIFTYPKEIWQGGQIHRVRKNILHLMRGQVYEIEGKTFFTMGGAYSIDRFLRILKRSYWEEELPSNAEYREATQNLREHHNAVDYIITHTAPRNIVHTLCKFPNEHDAELTGFLWWVSEEVSFKKWYFGHWHTDKKIDDRFTALWYDVVKIPTD